MKRLNILALTLTLGTILSSGLWAQQKLSESQASVAVKVGRVLDVRSGRYLERQLILIELDRIKEIGPASEIQQHIPENVRVIDLSQYTVLPGLIDCHTHMTFAPANLGYRGLGISVPREALIGARNAKLTLEAGFTTVRNLGANGFSDVALRDAINDGDVLGPRILASGPFIGITGGHADNSILAPQFHYSAGGVADGISQAMGKVRENIKYGADVIKFMATGGVISKGDNPGSEQFSPEEMRVIVVEAHRLGRKVAAHAHGAQGIKDAVLAGVDSIEHGTFIDEEGIRLMKEHATYLVPTLYAADWLLENYQKLGLTEDMMVKIKIVLPVLQQNAARTIRAGVKVAFGTDAAAFPHGLNAREFAVMVKVGMTPLQTIQSATLNAADLLGWTDRIGTLEPGKYADLIAVEGDPLKDVKLLEDVKFVMKGGQIAKWVRP